MRKRRLATVDLDTGEITDDLLVAAPKKRYIQGEFIMATQDALIRLAKDKDLTGEDLKVLLIYLGNLNFENYIPIHQAYIAEDLEMKKQNVSRATKKLVEKGILLEGAKVGRHQTYRLNPFYGWKGKADKKYWEEYEKHVMNIDI